jgi:CheY-like chemotaxis protein
MKNKHVLFFDDEPFITGMLIENLQKNYDWNKDILGEITFVSTPMELFDKVDDDNIQYDLFVLDIMVPIDQIEEMDFFSNMEIKKMQEGDNTGGVFAERIRKMPKYQNVPILFLSARMRPSKLMTNVDYLEKPVFASDVSEKMKKMMEI